MNEAFIRWNLLLLLHTPFIPKKNKKKIKKIIKENKSNYDNKKKRSKTILNSARVRKIAIIHLT